LSMVKTQKKPFDFSDLYCKDTVSTVVRPGWLHHIRPRVEW
jgi:hypothetical protein